MRCSGPDKGERELGEQCDRYGYNVFCMRNAFGTGNQLYQPASDSSHGIYERHHVGDYYYKTTRYAEAELEALTQQQQQQQGDEPSSSSTSNILQERKDSLGEILRNW